MDEKKEQHMMKKSRWQLENTDDPLEKLRLLCLSRGCKGIKNIGRLFHSIDDDDTGTIGFNEFRKALIDFGMQLTLEGMQQLFALFDRDASGEIDYNEFLVSLRPRLSNVRKELIERAFQKADKSGDGVLSMQDLLSEYDVRQHPKYSNGDMTKEEVYERFLKTFDGPDMNYKVTFDEFYTYYVGVSASIDDDAYFGAMMCSAWQL